jgi:hypothetical protein
VVVSDALTSLEAEDTSSVPSVGRVRWTWDFAPLVSEILGYARTAYSYDALRFVFMHHSRVLTSRFKYAPMLQQFVYGPICHLMDHQSEDVLGEIDL